MAQRVFVDYRPGCGIRVSPHFYTTDDEIDDILRGLEPSGGVTVIVVRHESP